MATDTKQGGSVTEENVVDRSARLLREHLTRCRRDVSLPLVDEHVRNTIKRIENDRAKPNEHIVTVMYDAFQRNAPRADLEAYPRAILAMIGDWYGDNAVMDLPKLIRQDTEAEAFANVVETELALSLNARGEVTDSKVLADATERLRIQLVALEQLVSACERKQMAMPVAPRMVA